MKKVLADFKTTILSKEEMKRVNGGKDDWYHSWACWCGMTYYEGQGNLSAYQSAASSNCASGAPVTCHFDTPGGGW